MLLLLFFFLGGGGRWEGARFERFLSIIISYFGQNGLGGGRWERARFECFLSIAISYFDQNGLGGEGGRELDLNVFFLLQYLILIKMAFVY